MTQASFGEAVCPIIECSISVSKGREEYAFTVAQKASWIPLDRRDTHSFDAHWTRLLLGIHFQSWLFGIIPAVWFRA